jgi:hypothetical protein
MVKQSKDCGCDERADDAPRRCVIDKTIGGSAVDMHFSETTTCSASSQCRHQIQYLFMKKLLMMIIVTTRFHHII